MAAVGSTCLVHSTTSSLHASVCCAPPYVSTRGTGIAVIPTSGTLWTYVPLVLPGLSPALLNWSVRYATVRCSPLVPGKRPSNSSDDRILVCATTAFMSTSGSWPIGVRDAAAGGAVSNGGG